MAETLRAGHAGSSGQLILLRLETTWGLEGQAEGSAVHLRSSSAWEGPEGDGQDQSSVQSPLLPWRAGCRVLARPGGASA